MAHDIAVIIGSLRKDSWTRKIAKAAMALAPETLSCRLVEIGGLALYNEDLDTGSPPAPWAQFRREIAKADGILFATPEYNRSIPGCLKNAIDVGSRPAGKNHWDGKPAAIVSVTPYKLGAMAANLALRQCLIFTNLPVMQQPEAYIGDAAKLLDESGQLASGETRKFLATFMARFAEWVAAVKRAKAA
jgi:NAD(P)H-dependent FMN reductase